MLSEIDYYVTNDLYTGLLYVNPDNTTQNNVNIRLNGQSPEDPYGRRFISN